MTDHCAATPSVAARHRSTACQSGVAYASQRSATGSDSTGKKTPAKSVIGITAKRNSSAR